MTQPSQPEAGKITSCIFHIFFSKLTVKNGILNKWVVFFLMARESACDYSVGFFPLIL